MKATTVTLTDKSHYCKHGNGWYKTIYFKIWIFTFKKRVFLCLDCENIIDTHPLPTNNSCFDGG